jgi:hypothetical protein
MRLRRYAICVEMGKHQSKIEHARDYQERAHDLRECWPLALFGDFVGS